MEHYGDILLRGVFVLLGKAKELGSFPDILGYNAYSFYVFCVYCLYFPNCDHKYLQQILPTHCPKPPKLP